MLAIVNVVGKAREVAFTLNHVVNVAGPVKFKLALGPTADSTTVCWPTTEANTIQPFPILPRSVLHGPETEYKLFLNPDVSANGLLVSNSQRARRQHVSIVTGA